MLHQSNSREVTYENTLLSILQAAKQIRASDLYQLALQLQRVELAQRFEAQVDAISLQEETIRRVAILNHLQVACRDTTHNVPTQERSRS